jgi:hypothetical protein
VKKNGLHLVSILGAVFWNYCFVAASFSNQTEPTHRSCICHFGYGYMEGFQANKLLQGLSRGSLNHFNWFGFWTESWQLAFRTTAFGITDRALARPPARDMTALLFFFFSPRPSKTKKGVLKDLNPIKKISYRSLRKEQRIRLIL